MIDTHAHLDSEQFSQDIDQLISDLGNYDIENVIIPAINPDNFDSVINLANNNERIFCGIGVHPHDADSYTKEVRNRILNLSENGKVKAIGEIGLDYYYNFSTPEQQKKVFVEQLEIAKDLNLPAIIHNRDSDDDLIRILKEQQNGNLNGVLHCFSGDLEFMNKALDLGMNLSFTGNITFKKFDRQDVVFNVPNDRFFLETDSPFMTPVPHRGKRNEPKYLNYVALKIAEIKEIDIKEVINMTTRNAKNFFNLLVLILIMVAAPNISAQNFDGEEVDYSDILEEQPHPYRKPLGLGLVLATNTIVESYEPRPMNVSYEGLLSLGGTIHYSLFDYLIFSASYGYSKNNKIVEKYPDVLNLQPNIHQQIELTSNFIINPYGRINFFGMVGFSYLLNEYGDTQNPGLTKTENSPGINTGLGFYINIPVNGAGLFNIVAEWKLNFMLITTKLNYDPRIEPGKPGSTDPVEVNTFFSMPRVSIVFFPENIF